MRELARIQIDEMGMAEVGQGVDGLLGFISLRDELVEKHVL